MIFDKKKQPSDKPDEERSSGMKDMTNTPTEMSGQGLFSADNKNDENGTGLNLKPSLSIEPPTVNVAEGQGAMSGQGLNIVKPTGSIASLHKVSPLRSMRSVASDAEPLNKLRELSFDHSRELTLAQLLVSRKLISEIQYEEVVSSLSASSKNFGTLIPISALFELQDIELVNMDSIINFLVEETKTPFLNLSSFRINNEVFTKLPPDIAERLGVVLFGTVGRSKQLALLNPLDKGIRRAICEYLDCNEISFFLVKPSDITPVYDKFRAQLAGL